MASEEQAGVKQLRELLHNGRSCSLVEWELPENFATLDDWLEKWKYSAVGNDGEVGFWRRRTVMAMQQRLELRCRPDFSGRGEDRDRAAQDGFRVIALHLAGTLTAPPLALAVVDQRSLSFGSLESLLLSQITVAPDVPSELRGAGVTLILALLRLAAEADLILTIEPQSKELELFFGRLGFRNAPIVDPYLWFLVDGSGGKALELRYVLPSRKDYDRLLVAFKRYPIWLARSEEAFITLREDASARTVVGVRMSRMEVVAQARASVRKFARAGAGGAYRAGPPESVDVVEAMGVMRNPSLLDQLEWKVLEGLSSPPAVGPRYVIAGRCTVAQRAYPLPGAPGLGLELVIDELELPNFSEPIFSAVVQTRLAAIAEASAAVKSLLEKFRVRAAFRPASEAWNLELVQSDGLAAAVLQPSEMEEEVDSEL